MSLTIRPYRPDDGPAVVALTNLTRNAPLTLEQWREMEQKRPEQLRLCLIADVDGYQVGCAEVSAPAWLPAGKLLVKIVVDPQWRRRGIGRRLWAAVDPALHRMGPAGIEVAIRDNDSESRMWAERRGFRFSRQSAESVLDLEHFDPAPHTAPLPESIRLFSLADVPGEESERRYYELWATLMRQTPDLSGADPMSYEEFRRYNYDSPRVYREGLLIAADGDEWVGLSAVLQQKANPEEFYTFMTGVLPEYRGRGIARALKLATIEFARSRGARSMRTNNDSRNEPMLAVNQRLGYVAQSGQWWLERFYPGRPEKKWTVWSSLLMLAANFGVQVVVGIILGIVVAAASIINPGLRVEQWLMPLILFGSMGGAVILLLAQVRRKGRLPLWDSRDLKDWRAWGLAVLALLVVYGANVLRIALEPNPDVPEINQELLNLLGGHAGGGVPWVPVIMIWSSTVLLAPLAEEWLFRGIVQRTLTVKWGPWVGIPVTSAIFGLFHGFSMWWVATVYGLAFGFLAHKRQNLTFPMLVHGALNFTVMLLTTLAGR